MAHHLVGYKFTAKPFLNVLWVSIPEHDETLQLFLFVLRLCPQQGTIGLFSLAYYSTVLLAERDLTRRQRITTVFVL